MDDIVKQAMAKWPQVPACFGWLGLCARGELYMRDDATQALGTFAGGVPEAKGSRLMHEGLTAFIHRNCDAETTGVLRGAWFFQNGPQRVYIELEVTPLVLRVVYDAARNHTKITSHKGDALSARVCLTDELGRVYLATPMGLGLVHTLDVGHAADALQGGVWQLEEALAADLPANFGYVMSPQRAAAQPIT